jgi:N-acetylneuraminic acid mutarotase
MRQLFVVALLLATAGCSDDAAGPGWERRAPAPSERTEVGAGVLGGRIWVVGGLTEHGASAEVTSYDPAADSWTRGPRLPEARHHTGVAGDGKHIWVVGGYTDDPRRPAAEVWSATNGTWTAGPALPEPRAAGAVAWDGRRLVYAGGVGPNGVSGDVFALTSGEWQRIGTLDTAREHLSAASDGRGTVWFLGGRVHGLDSNRTEVDVVTGGRVRKAGDIPTPRGGVAGFYAPGRGGCAAGGEGTEGTFDEVECVSANGTVATLPNLARGRHGLGAAVVDGVAYTLLGGPTPGLSASDVVEALRL